MQKVQLSIHPRHWPAPWCPGKDKQNTAKPTKKPQADQPKTKK